MLRRTAARMLALLGCHEVSERGDRVVSSCPFARWEHGGGVDKHPSFGVFQTPDGLWRYHCFSCGAKGDLVALWWRLARLGGRPNAQSLALAWDLFGSWGGRRESEIPVRALSYRVGGGVVASAPSRHAQGGSWHGVAGSRHGDGLGLTAPEIVHRKPKATYVPPTEEQLARYRAVPMPEYAVRRGYAEVYEAFGCGYNERDKRMVVPIRARDGGLIGFTSRSTWEEDYCFVCGETLIQRRKSDGVMRRVHRCVKCGTLYEKWLHTKGLPRFQVLFGIHLWDGSSPLVVVEGPGDVMRLYGHGVRSPVATLGTNVDREQIQQLASYKVPVVMMGDGDKAGRKFNETAGSALRALGVTVRVVEVPDGEDPGSVDGAWAVRAIREALEGVA